MIRKIVLTLLVLIASGDAGLLSSGLAIAQDQTPTLRLARFDLDATPQVGMEMAYDTVSRVDELGLRCRGIVLMGAGDPIVLCAVDWIGIGNEGHDLFRQVLAHAAGTSPDRVAVHSLHQHDAPRFDASAERLLIEAGVSNLGSFQSSLARDVLKRLTPAVQFALRSAVPISEVGYGVAPVIEVASNRRIKGPDGKIRATRYTATRDPALRAEPEGVIDPELTSIAFFNGAEPVAILTYYACHPQSYYRTGVPSPDFPGIARFMHSQDVPSALHVHFNGAGGNLGAGKYNDGSPANRLILAGRLADGMRAAYQTVNRIPISPELVSWKVEPVHLPVAAHLDAATMRANLAKWKTTEFFGSPDRLAFLQRAHSGQPIELTCLTLGPVRILGMPGELFVEYQLAAKAMRPDLTIAMAAYGDYAPGYIGTAIAYEEGGYETEPRSSNVGPGVEAVLLEALRKLLADQPTTTDYGAQLPRIPPREPHEVASTFDVLPGFHMQLTAAEPLVTSPVAMQWDERGDLFVCEMRGYSEHRDDRISRVTQLRDLDQDGVYDQSTIYVDHLFWPTAIFPYDGGLLVVDAPDVLFFKDTNGDGRADHREVLLTGLSIANVQGLANSFRWGLDNRIHLAGSSNGGRVHVPAAGPETAVEIRGHDLVLDPRTRKWTLSAGAAQHGMAFDDWGRKFTCSNSDHLQQVMYAGHYVSRNTQLIPAPVRISIASDGPQAEVYRISPVEPWRILRTRLRVRGDVSGPIEGGGRAAGYFTGATGVNIYRGDAYPPEWKDEAGNQSIAIVGDVGGNLIHRKQLNRQNVQMTASRLDPDREWIASRDIWFRPAQFENGPDGALHAIDVYREVIEHPHSLPPEIKQHLDLNSGRDRGRLYRILPTNFQHRPTPDLGSCDSEALVPYLAHANAWHRETAARLLYQRNDQSVAEILENLYRTTESSLGKVHALYALHGLERLSPALLQNALQDSHPQVRRQAVLLSESHLASDDFDEPWRTSLLELARDPDPEVRYQLAFTLGNLPPELPASNGRPAFQPDPGTNVRPAFQPDSAVGALVILAEQDGQDRWMQSAIQSSLPGKAGSFIIATIREETSNVPLTWLERLVRQAINEGDFTNLLEMVVSLRQGKWAQNPDVLFVATPLLKALEAKLPETSDAIRERELLEECRVWLNSLKLQTVENAFQAVELAQATESESPEVHQAIRLLAMVEPALAIEPLLSWVLPANSPNVQGTAVQTLATFRSPEIADHYLTHWRTFSPSIQTQIADQLVSNPLYIDATLTAMENGSLLPTDLNLSRLQAIMNNAEKSLRQRASRLVQAAGQTDRTALIADYRERMKLPGDVPRGRELFRLHCSACHQMEGLGYPVGPILAGISQRGLDFVLSNVLDPNMEVNPQYQAYVALLTDGRIATGMIVEENATSVTLQRGEGIRESLLRSELSEIQNTGQSLMPEGLERSLDYQQMADLLTYLFAAE